MKTREDIVKLIKPGSVGVELGVFKGDFSQVLLDSGKFNVLHLVDPFQSIVASGDKHGQNLERHLGEVLFKHLNDRFKDRCEVSIHRKTSTEFLATIKTQSIDFIYIDTLHDYDYTTLELNEALRVIRPGGFICGHDYDERAFPGCYKAVNDFSDINNLKFELTSADGLASYVFKIPE